MSEVDRYLDNPYLKFKDHKKEEVSNPLLNLGLTINRQAVIIKELQELVVILKKDLKNALMINAPVPGVPKVLGFDHIGPERKMPELCNYCKKIHGRCSCP